MQQRSDEPSFDPLDIQQLDIDIPIPDITDFPLDFDPEQVLSDIPDIEIGELDVQELDKDFYFSQVNDLETDPDIIRMLSDCEKELDKLI